MTNICITRFEVIQNHPYLRALADLNISGLQLRGLRLEEKNRGGLTLGFPGRKIQGQWQVVYEANCPQMRDQILQSLECCYRNWGLAA